MGAPKPDVCHIEHTYTKADRPARTVAVTTTPGRHPLPIRAEPGAGRPGRMLVEPEKEVSDEARIGPR
jgi:hypothetical protein